MTEWVLILMLFNYSEAVHSSHVPGFASQATCEAAKAITASAIMNDPGKQHGYRIYAACVERTAKGPA